MGASSVTGTGYGSVSSNKNIDIDVKKLIGPKVIAAGKVFMNSSNECIMLPQYVGSVTDYIPMLTPTTKNGCYVSSPLEVFENNWKFNICGESSSTIYWSLIKVGF